MSKGQDESCHRRAWQVQFNPMTAGIAASPLIRDPTPAAAGPVETGHRRARPALPKHESGEAEAIQE